MVSFWWVGVAQETAVTLAGEVSGSWVGYVGTRVVKSDTEIFLCFFGGGVLVRRVVGYLGGSR